MSNDDGGRTNDLEDDESEEKEIDGEGLDDDLEAQEDDDKDWGMD